MAACYGHDLDAFFAERGDSTPVLHAKTICNGGVSPLDETVWYGCPVRDQCLEYAIENEIRHGCWGGTSERDRRKIRRQRRGPTRQSRPS